MKLLFWLLSLLVSTQFILPTDVAAGDMRGRLFPVKATCDAEKVIMEGDLGANYGCLKVGGA